MKSQMIMLEFATDTQRHAVNRGYRDLEMEKQERHHEWKCTNQERLSQNSTNGGTEDASEVRGRSVPVCHPKPRWRKVQN